MGPREYPETFNIEQNERWLLMPVRSRYGRRRKRSGRRFNSYKSRKMRVSRAKYRQVIGDRF